MPGRMRVSSTKGCSLSFFAAENQKASRWLGLAPTDSLGAADLRAGLDRLTPVRQQEHSAHRQDSTAKSVRAVEFPSFDSRQRALAAAVGLRVAP